MHKGNETRRGCNLGRAPECVCSAADIRKVSLNPNSGQAFTLREVASGAYIQSFDPGVSMPGRTYLTGRVEFTKSRAQALHFVTLGDVLDFINQQPEHAPIRPDGKPNRPLTSLTLLVEAVPSHFGRAS